MSKLIDPSPERPLLSVANSRAYCPWLSVMKLAGTPISAHLDAPAMCRQSFLTYHIVSAVVQYSTAKLAAHVRVGSWCV